MVNLQVEEEVLPPAGVEGGHRSWMMGGGGGATGVEAAEWLMSLPLSCLAVHPPAPMMHGGAAQE